MYQGRRGTPPSRTLEPITEHPKACRKVSGGHMPVVRAGAGVSRHWGFLGLVSVGRGPASARRARVRQDGKGSGSSTPGGITSVTAAGGVSTRVDGPGSLPRSPVRCADLRRPTEAPARRTDDHTDTGAGGQHTPAAMRIMPSRSQARAHPRPADRAHREHRSQRTRDRSRRPAHSRPASTGCGRAR